MRLYKFIRVVNPFVCPVKAKGAMRKSEDFDTPFSIKEHRFPLILPPFGHILSVCPTKRSGVFYLITSASSSCVSRYDIHFNMDGHFSFITRKWTLLAPSDMQFFVFSFFEPAIAVVFSFVLRSLRVLIFCTEVEGISNFCYSTWNYSYK